MNFGMITSTEDLLVVLKMFNWKLFALFTVCAICYGLISGEYSRKVKSARLVVFIWPAITVIGEIAEAFTNNQELIWITPLRVTIALMAFILGMVMLVISSIAFAISEGLQQKEEERAKKAQKSDEKILETYRFKCNFAYEVSRAEPGTYIVDKMGHLTPTKH